MATPASFDLTISNYKSIAGLKIDNLRPFSVFVGPNGSGKSNFFDALDFVGKVCSDSSKDALRTHGGADHIRSAKLSKAKNQRFEFGMTVRGADPTNQEWTSEYQLRIHDLGTKPKLKEVIPGNDGEPPIRRPAWESVSADAESPAHKLARLLDSRSALVFFSHSLSHLLRNITVYRINPRAAKAPNAPGADPYKLDSTGSNLATVMRRLEGDPEARDIMREWMEMIVPGVETVATKRRLADKSKTVLFKERKTGPRFPAAKMSDGTICALGMLVAVLARSRPCMTLIEEPAHGLHPAAVAQFIEFFREEASAQKPIWLTTHSETVVRQLLLEELVLVDKKAGRTVMKRAYSGNLTDADLAHYGLDAAWLANLFNAGVPW